MQGGGIEDSESWDRDQPPSAAEALAMVDALVNRLPGREQNLRADAIDTARTYIERCRTVGGVSAPIAPKSCVVRGDRDNRRVDIEIFTGRAFVP
jgi:hypothetical protein